MPAQQPTNISRYEIRSRIGRGGMGDLYLGFDPNTNRLVAIKLLNATLDSTELRERFAREARALAALNHPNIVNIYDTGEFEDSPFIVMEYVRGETIAELIKRRAAISVSQKLKLMEELCAGLSQAHEAGIIHRDIKPANLMVDQQNRLKILDFGIARVAETNRTRVGMPLTMMNMQIGTPGYMAPEQIEAGEVDHRCDIFAVGAVCYEFLAFDEAFSGANTNQIESRVMRGTPRPLATLVPGLDPEIDEIILRALKTDPNKRYQDAATFQRALERYRLRLEPDTGDAPARPTPPPSSGRGKPREARAEAAYQRALASYQAGSRDAARRFAVEAIAEDSSHAGARALLSRLEKRSPDTPAAPPPENPPPARARPESAPTMISGPTRAPAAPGSTLASGSTVVSGAPFTASSSGSGSTIVSGETIAPDSTMA
ncbi:MAG TPA: serine/threonine-protein kinase, partial [Vicinamibacterales bacterium]|nr:serine/threonine-protein kinase [Vicinamibacterales bacterium]